MTFGSLFAGIGGMDLGLERAGMICKWQVEIDPFCTKVLAKHWPGVKRYGDIRTVDPELLERVDAICGGFPCQDVSLAGARAGIGIGTRSGLYRELIRIALRVRPRYLILENVPGLLAAIGEPAPMGRVLADLAKGGYDAEWDCLPAAAFGADHIRDRVFIVAQPHGFTRLIFGNQEAYGGKSPNWKDFNYWGEKRNWGHGNPQRLRLDSIRRAADRGVLPLANGIPGTMDELRSIGNAIVPQVAQYIGVCVMAHYRRSIPA